METTTNNQYKSIEVDNQTLIMNETQAFRILHAMKREFGCCLLYTSPSPRDRTRSRMPSSA